MVVVMIMISNHHHEPHHQHHHHHNHQHYYQSPGESLDMLAPTKQNLLCSGRSVRAVAHQVDMIKMIIMIVAIIVELMKLMSDNIPSSASRLSESFEQLSRSQAPLHLSGLYCTGCFF